MAGFIFVCDFIVLLNWGQNQWWRLGLWTSCFEGPREECCILLGSWLPQQSSVKQNKYLWHSSLISKITVSEPWSPSVWTAWLTEPKVYIIYQDSTILTANWKGQIPFALNWLCSMLISSSLTIAGTSKCRQKRCHNYVLHHSLPALIFSLKPKILCYNDVL